MADTALNARSADTADVDDALSDASAEVEDDTWRQPCMGEATFCDRPYNQLAQVCTHNAMSSEAYGFSIPTPNQVHGFTRQLDDGVRCLMLDIYDYEGEAHLCHSGCGVWGAYPLQDGLQEIAAWLEAHPFEIVTFILESYVPEEDVLESLQAAGFAAAERTAESGILYHHDRALGEAWPTIGEMLARDERLVVFTDDPDATASWHLDWRQFGWETPFNDATFTCEDGRGDPLAAEHQVFILNHYTLCPLGGCVSEALKNNAYETVLSRMWRCSEAEPAKNPWGQPPTFVNVDHYQSPAAGGPGPEPDVVEAVRAFNLSWSPSGGDLGAPTTPEMP